MTALSLLWLPILLSAVVVFLASSIIHMALTFWHRSDYPRIPNEDQVRNALRPLAIPPGDYMVPRPQSNEDMRSPEFIEKIKQGPNFIMTMLPSGEWTMGKNLALWFVYSAVVAGFSGYIASRALPPGAEYLKVFQLVGASAFMGFALALWQNSIWYYKKLSTTIKVTIDGLIYALLTAGVFGWLWPQS